MQPYIQKRKENKESLKPFIKWAGGKNQLLPVIREAYPKELNYNISKYIEPFVGGGAVLFDILNRYNLKEIYINDINAELINTYKMIQKNIDALISSLYKIQSDYIILDNSNREKFYYERREQFNHLKLNNSKTTKIKKAALFIFLNKTCFNGLYRVNKQGHFNVPIGRYKNPKICDTENLQNISRAIQNLNIMCLDYKQTLKYIDINSFIYIDPPYRPISNSSNFTSYTENQFNDEKQIELAQFIDKINKKGAKIIVSNSDPKNLDNEDEFFDILYKDYYIYRIEANRMINCNGKLRGKINELLISNFKKGD